VLAVVALIAAGAVLSQRGGTATPQQVPAVRTDLPPRLQQDLQDLADQVARS
jgi:hypothetical protein